MTFKLYQ